VGFRHAARAVLEAEGYDVVAKARHYRALLERSGAGGFIPKAEICGAAVAALAD
jgi:hypothetical protein